MVRASKTSRRSLNHGTTAVVLGVAGWCELLDLVEDPTPPIGLAARLDVSGLLADSVALATLAIQQIQVASGELEVLPPVRLAGDRITTSAQSERHLKIDGHAATMWPPCPASCRPVTAGSVRTATTRSRGLTELLGLHPGSSNEEVSAAIATRGVFELEGAAGRYRCGHLLIRRAGVQPQQFRESA